MDSVLTTAFKKIIAESGPLVEEIFEDLYERLERPRISRNT